MKLFKFGGSVGKKGYGQIKSGHHNFEELNSILITMGSEGLKQFARSVFDLRYDAKATDLISPEQLGGKVWFVNFRFLGVLEKHHPCPFELEPALLRHRDRFLDDYFIFRTIKETRNYHYSEHIDFSRTVFELSERYPPGPPRQYMVKDFNEYLQIMEERQKKQLNIRLIRIGFHEPQKYDLFNLHGFAHSFTHVITEPLKDSLVEKKINGIHFVEFSQDPFQQIGQFTIVH